MTSAACPAMHEVEPRCIWAKRHVAPRVVEDMAKVDDVVLGKREVVALGASAGGLQALIVVLSGFPADLPAPVFVVQHLDPRHESHMADILTRHSRIRVVEAADGDIIEKSVAYLAPPGRHMLVEQDHIRLTTTELVHFVRPSVDLLFESIAAVYNRKAVGVVLTGSGVDGAMGIRAIKETGGLTIAQDPESAENPGMPRAAITTGAVDLILPIERIAETLIDAIATED